MAVPSLPRLLDRKLYKTGQTRGADDDQIWQNRVLRSSTVLIGYDVWLEHAAIRQKTYDNGYIVLIPPKDYFTIGSAHLATSGLKLADNMAVFYTTRADWTASPPDKYGWNPPVSRNRPIGGEFVARVASTTSETAARNNQGFTDGSMKGAGIRVYEYADKTTIAHCQIKLESLYWLSIDAVDAAVKQGMTKSAAESRREYAMHRAAQAGLLQMETLDQSMMVNAQAITTCPLCLEEMRGEWFYQRERQAAGREVHDLTVTTASLFHVQELRIPNFNHRPYNVAWGHHHCNVVCRDAGILQTLDWMSAVVSRNVK